MWYCSECGKKNSGKFCTRCGTKYVEIDDDAPAYDPSAEEKTPAFIDKLAADDQWKSSARPRGLRFDMGEGEETPSASLRPSMRGQLDSEAAPAEAVEEPAVVTEETIEVAEEPTEPAEEPVEEHLGMKFPDDLAELAESEEGDGVFLMEEPEESEESEEPEPAEEAPAVKTFVIAEETGGSIASFRGNRISGGQEEEPGQTAFLRRENKTVSIFEEIPADLGVDGVFAHRQAPETGTEKQWKYGKRAVIGVGAVCGVILLVLIAQIGSLFLGIGRDDNTRLPDPTGVYSYVSGVKDTLPLYADKSIASDVLAELENGNAVDVLESVNAQFAFVFDPATEQYGYVQSLHLVSSEEDVDYGNVENKYKDEKKLGYYYVTKVKNKLNLWENPDGSGVVRAQMDNGFKVSVLEKTNKQYWYVFDYNSAERGYVRTAYLTDDKSKVVGIVKEPEDKTVIGTLYVTGVKEYLPIYAEPRSGSKERGKLINGDQIGLIQKTNSSFWYIAAGKTYGWVSAKYVTTTPPAPEPPAEPETPPEPTTPENLYTVVNTNDYLPILDIADNVNNGAKELAKLNNGNTVFVLDKSKDPFWYIETWGGIKGYVVKDYLTR